MQYPTLNVGVNPDSGWVVEVPIIIITIKQSSILLIYLTNWNAVGIADISKFMADTKTKIWWGIEAIASRYAIFKKAIAATDCA